MKIIVLGPLLVIFFMNKYKILDVLSELLISSNCNLIFNTSSKVFLPKLLYVFIIEIGVFKNNETLLILF